MTDGELKKQIRNHLKESYEVQELPCEHCFYDIVDEAKKDFEKWKGNINIVQSSGERLSETDLENLKVAVFEIVGGFMDWFEKWFGDSS